jgi:hypothetical protein
VGRRDAISEGRNERKMKKGKKRGQLVTKVVQEVDGGIGRTQPQCQGVLLWISPRFKEPEEEVLVLCYVEVSAVVPYISIVSLAGVP